LRAVGTVGPGDRVLVIGAAGGLGLAAMQIARHLGATVIGAVADRAKLDGLERFQPDAVVDYADPAAMTAAVRAATDGRGVSVAVDNVGSPELWPHVVASVDKHGRIVSCGAHAGGIVSLDMSYFYRMQLRFLATAGTTAQEFRDALALVADGTVGPVASAIRPLDAIAESFGDLQARRNVGKIVVQVRA
jgi:NADPH:quinone reductase-like Zn-dependent oxidoreductase